MAHDPARSQEIADWLKSRRTDLNLSLRELARRMDVSHVALADIEKNNYASVSLCKKLAEFFNEPQEFVLRLAGHLDQLSDPKGALMNNIVLEAGRLGEDDIEEVLEFIRMKSRMKAQRRKGL